MNVLLDTSTLIRFARGNQACIARIRFFLERGETMGCCDVTIAEFYAGTPYGRDARWDELIDSLDYWTTTRSAAMRAGEIRRDALIQNRVLSLPNALIAAVTIEQSALLLTANPRDFQIPGLAMKSVP